MKSISAYSMTLLVVFLLGLCSLNLQSVSAKTLVRGDHRPKTLKHFSMHSRQLMKEKEVAAAEEAPEDEDEDEDEDEQENEKKKNDEEAEDEDEDEDEDEEEPVAEEDPDEVAGVVEPAVDAGVMNTTASPETAMPMPETGDEDGEEPGDVFFTVALEPFSLTIDGTIAEDDLNLEEYLLNYMKQFMANLVDIDLTASVVEDPEEVVEEEPEEMPMDNSTRTRSLRAYQVARVLAVQTFYFEGTATFQGPPMRATEEVNSALTYALEDTAALQAHLEASSPAANATITSTKPKDPKPEPDAIGVDEEPADEGGLSTTGLSIVIVAAVVGGLSLIIIMMVGLSGPSGSTGKDGIPEQPR